MGGFAYNQLSNLDESFQTRGRIERAARELYTVNGLIDHFQGQSAQFRATPTQDQVDGMRASLTAIDTLASGLVERAINADRRAAYAGVHAETRALAAEIPKLADLGTIIRENKVKLFAAGDLLTKTTNALVAEIRAGSDADVTATAGAVESAVLLVRVSAWRFLATNDP